MKMISNDLRSSCRSLLLGAYQGGGGKRYDPVFHDILDSAETVTEFHIDDTYRISAALWVTERPDVYDMQYENTVFCAAYSAEGQGYCQNFDYCYHSAAHLVYILWRGDTPLYAALSGNVRLIGQQYTNVDVHGSNDTDAPCVYYAYQSMRPEYVKGSARLTNEIDHQEWSFGSFHGVKVFRNSANLYNSSGSGVSLGVTFTVKNHYYTYVRPKCEWTDPNTGATSTIDDRTAVPRIIPDYTSEVTMSVSSNSSTLYFYPKEAGTYSDLETCGQVMDAYNELVGAVCRANGAEHNRAQLLLPESEE